MLVALFFASSQLAPSPELAVNHQPSQIHAMQLVILTTPCEDGVGRENNADVKNQNMHGVCNVS